MDKVCGQTGIATLVVDKDVKVLLRICDHHLVIVARGTSRALTAS